MFRNFSQVPTLFGALTLIQNNVVPRRLKFAGRFFEKPVIGHGKSFRRIVHFPEEYTVKPLNVTNLGGRDPETGRVAVNGIGGGIKHKYHWIKWYRDGPSEGPPLEEKVLKILKCGCRTGHVALVGSNDQLKYILATENMKPGDIIKTSKVIPSIPYRANEGDAYPVGGLIPGTLIHNVQLHPSSEVTIVHSAGSYATIKGTLDDKVVITLRNRAEYAIEKTCMATVGRVSNAGHMNVKLGTPQRNRELGNRPRSGLWQSKRGRSGRVVRPPPKVKIIQDPKLLVRDKPIRCTIPYITPY
ncbi:UNVERIFIED_CONTAM: hypothetical protein PYX00_006075 [Menopon gallinae]|uniref:Ribosomal protein L2 n=1 Tax=Menopon gallinae TaxID=328185 RepID=A0AAW2HUG0_9NEOP